MSEVKNVLGRSIMCYRNTEIECPKRRGRDTVNNSSWRAVRLRHEGDRDGEVDG